MARAYIVEHLDGLSVQDREGGAGYLFATYGQKDSATRKTAELIANALNNYQPFLYHP